MKKTALYTKRFSNVSRILLAVTKVTSLSARDQMLRIGYYPCCRTQWQRWRSIAFARECTYRLSPKAQTVEAFNARHTPAIDELQPPAVTYPIADSCVVKRQTVPSELIARGTQWN